MPVVCVWCTREELQALAGEDLRRLLGVQGPPAFFRCCFLSFRLSFLHGCFVLGSLHEEWVPSSGTVTSAPLGRGVPAACHASLPSSSPALRARMRYRSAVLATDRDCAGVCESDKLSLSRLDSVTVTSRQCRCNVSTVTVTVAMPVMVVAKASGDSDGDSGTRQCSRVGRKWSSVLYSTVLYPVCVSCLPMQAHLLGRGLPRVWSRVRGHDQEHPAAGEGFPLPVLRRSVTP